MKNLLPVLLTACLFTLPGCGSKGTDPTPTTVTPPAPADAVKASWVVTNNGVPVVSSMGVNTYGDVYDNTGFFYVGSEAIIDILFLINGYDATARVKYSLTSSIPTPGTVKYVVAQPYNDYDFRHTATGTVTGRRVTTNGVTRLYLSGKVQGNFGPLYPALTCTFTDLRVH